MAKIKPLEALYYSPEKIQATSVLTPPYDNISKELEIVLKRRSEYNFAHVDLPGQNYTHAKDLMDRWIQSGVLVHEDRPRYFLYRQDFSVAGKSYQRSTLLAAVQLTDFADHIVRPHEQTHSGPKEDRLKLLQATQCQLSPVFGVVADPAGDLEQLFTRWALGPALIQGNTEDGVKHSLWRAPEKEEEKVTSLFADRPLYIVDGHHRYGSALTYAKERGVYLKDQPAAYIYFAIARSEDPGLLIFPTHRLVTRLSQPLSVERLSECFDLQRTGKERARELSQNAGDNPSFVLSRGGDLFHCSVRRELVNGISEKLSVHWTDDVLLGKICALEGHARQDVILYERDFERAWERAKECALTLFVPPLNIGSMMEVADAKLFLPQKTTFFYPKLASGLLLRPLE